MNNATSERISMTAEEQKMVMLKILVKFAQFCDKNNLQYFLDAGTLLGAVRHKGYIPWDDDVDVGMLREDFNRFCKLIKEENAVIDEHLTVEFPEDTIYPFMKISDNRTVLVEFPHKNPIECGVYIDVFTKYGVKNLKVFSKFYCKISEFLGLWYWFCKYSVKAWPNSKNHFRKIIAKTAKLFIKDGTFPIKLQKKFLDWHAKKFPLEKCEYVTTLTNGEFHKCAPKECFKETVLLGFEGYQLKCPVGYDKYLRCLYSGDYMQLPPEDKRVAHTTVVYWKSQKDKDDFLKENEEK